MGIIKKLLEILSSKHRNIILQLYDRFFLDQTVKNVLRTYDNISKIVTGQGDEYTSEYFLDYSSFQKLL